VRKNIPDHYTDDEINALVDHDKLAVIIGPAVYTMCNEEKGSDDEGDDDDDQGYVHGERALQDHR
jgi:hypothetical protein